ncbi:MAG: acetolactate decarboxylase, partial [Candidatus Omnitrophica bacterium]|nr:acetolactate decarboxylase [Candidatus Omnitrophota bacterium]
DDVTTPCAVVTFFRPDQFIKVENIPALAKLEEYLNTLLPSPNIFFAIRIEGRFQSVKTRSVPAQKKPYPPLLEVAKQQSLFEFHNVDGTIIGFRCPNYAKEINVSGYHLHFITAEKNGGGHLLDCFIKEAKISIAKLHKLHLVLPDSPEFYRVDLSKNKQEEVKQVEKQSDK